MLVWGRVGEKQPTFNLRIPEIRFKFCIGKNDKKKKQNWFNLRWMSLLNSCVPGSKVLVLGMVIPPLIGNPHNGNINPYYWVHDHLLLYGNIKWEFRPWHMWLEASILCKGLEGPQEYPTIPLLLLPILEFSLGTLAGPMDNINNEHHVPIPQEPIS